MRIASAHLVRRRPKMGFEVEGGAVGLFLIISLRHDEASVRGKFARVNSRMRLCV
jgi:hypothetical protein